MAFASASAAPLVRPKPCLTFRGRVGVGGVTRLDVTGFAHLPCARGGRRVVTVVRAARDESLTTATDTSDWQVPNVSGMTNAMRDLGPATANPLVVATVASSSAVATPTPSAGVMFTNPGLVAGVVGAAAATVACGVFVANATRKDSQQPNELEIMSAFGGGDKKFPIIKKYATNVSERYATQLPKKLQAVVFTEIIKVAALGAFSSLYVNIKQADALGHPVVLINQLNLQHTPRTPEVNAEDVEKFVLDVLDQEDEHVGFIPRSMETELIRNAFVAGIYIMEDAVQSFSARLFGSTYSLEIAPAKRGWQRPKLGTNVTLTDAQLTKLVREELKAPLLTRFAPSLEQNVARVAVALAGEVVGTAEFVFLGLPLKFRLRAKETAVSETVMDAAAQEMLSEERNSKEGATKEITSENTDAIIEAYVEAYMSSRGGGFGAGGSFFFSKNLERNTYVGFLKQIFGTIHGATVAEVLGFDIVVSVGEVTRGSVNALDLNQFRERLTKSSSKESREEIETFVDWLMADPVYNIKAVPDSVERQVYINVFDLLSSLVSVAFSTFEVQLLGREIKMTATPATAECLKTDLSNEKPFKPDPAVIRAFAQSVTSVGAAQEVMVNVFSFALAFVAFEIKSISAVLVGRSLSVNLALPYLAEGAFTQTDLDESLDVEFNASLRNALTLLAQEMLLASPKSAGNGKEAFLSPTTLEDEDSRNEESGPTPKFSDLGNGFRGVLDSAREVLSSFGAFASMDDEDKILGRSSPSRTGGLNGGSTTLERATFEDTVYSTFVKNHTPPDAKFPFAYLTPNSFDEAVTELASEIRPGEKVPRSATAAVAAAADANGDGVIQWQEYYFCAKELNAVLSKSGVL